MTSDQGRTTAPQQTSDHDDRTAARVAAVTAAGTELLDWVRRNAPVSASGLRPGLPAEEVRELLEAGGVPAPAELVAWLSLCDGVGYDMDAMVFPFNVPLGARDVVAEHEVNVQPQRDAEAAGESDAVAADGATQPAGTPGAGYVPQLVPIGGDGLGNNLVLDTRPGARSGLVAEWQHDDVSTSEQTWDDLGTFLADVVAALRTGAAVGGWRPRVEDGCVEWDVADG